MGYITRIVAHCDVCGHEWIPRIPQPRYDKRTGERIPNPQPTNCASSKCRSFRWNAGHKEKKQ